MFCENCGRELEKTDLICPTCKYPVNNQNSKKSESFSYNVIYGQGKCIINGIPMNWYQFIIWGYLIFMFAFESVFAVIEFVALLNSIFSIFSIPAWIIVNALYFVFHVVMAIWSYISRWKLARFKYGAIKSFLICLIIFTIGNVLLTVLNMVKNPFMAHNYFMWLVIFIINGSFMIPFNYFYFKRRGNLFYN